MFRRKKKHEIVLESAIYDIVHAMAYAASAFGTANINVDGLTVMFDDSIIEDKEAQSNRALRELSAGVKSPEEYRVEIYGESEEVAEQKIQSIQEKHPTMQSLIGGE